jgi:hypothetical protein
MVKYTQIMCQKFGTNLSLTLRQEITYILSSAFLYWCHCSIVNRIEPDMNVIRGHHQMEHKIVQKQQNCKRAKFFKSRHFKLYPSEGTSLLLATHFDFMP